MRSCFGNGRRFEEEEEVGAAWVSSEKLGSLHHRHHNPNHRNNSDLARHSIIYRPCSGSIIVYKRMAEFEENDSVKPPDVPLWTSISNAFGRIRTVHSA